jgi:hypothetical protein
MRDAEVALDDKFLLTEGRVSITSVAPKGALRFSMWGQTDPDI